MKPIDMDKKADKEPSGSRWSRRPAFVKTIAHYLQDNRLKTGSAETRVKLRKANKNQKQSNLLLKKILNIICVVLGMANLLAVFLWIIYTSIDSGHPDDRVKDDVTVVKTTPGDSDDGTRVRRSLLEIIFPEVNLGRI